MGRARYGDRAGFGVRVAFCAVATVLLVVAALGPRRLGGLQATRRDPATVYLNGSRVTGPPGSVMLTPHQEIAMTGRPGLADVPVGYAFPPGT